MRAPARAIAHGGQTLLSAATRDLVGDRLPDGASLRDLGSHRLKDLGVPERVWQLCHPELPAEFAPVRSLDAMVNNLPAQLTSFVGRDEQVAGLRTLLADARLVTLIGAGGAGKTRLAAHTVAEVADEHRDGVWWVELAPLTDPDLLPFAVARGLGVQLEGTRPPADVLCERASGLEALLALDNCEHLVDACAALVGRLLAAAPGLWMVATSREPLGVPGEVTWRVPPLDDEAAARLFVDRAAQVRPGFDPDAAEVAAIGSICRRLDGIPLAIELAAARVRMMSPGDIAEALDDRFRLLTGGGRTVLPRQQTLETSVAWSHDLLDERERALLSGRTSSQDVSLDRMAANLDNLQVAYVWALSGGRTEAALRIGTALFPLWRMRGRRLEGSTWLDEALAAPGEAAPEHRLRALIARARLPFDASVAGADRVDEAVRLARQLGDPTLLARALIGGVCYTSRGPAAWRTRLLEGAELAERLGDPEVLVEAKLRLTLVSFVEGDPLETIRLAGVAQSLATVHGDRYGVRQLGVFHALALLMQSDARAALRLLRPASDEASALGDRAVAQYSLASEGWAFALLDEQEQADRVCAAAAAMAGRGERAHDAMERLGFGMAVLVRGAVEAAACALARGRELTDGAPGFSDVFAGPEAEVVFAPGDVEGCRRLADGVIARHRELRLPWAAGWALLARARVALADGQSGRAEDLAQEALAVRAAMDDLGGVADSLEFLAGLAAGQGSTAEAVRLLGAAQAARERRGCRRPGIYGEVEALVDRLRGDVGESVFAGTWAQGSALDAPDAVAYASRGRGERRRPASGWAALTPSEHEVTRLVAEGLRNKEIAARLFVSPRTVQAHLSNTFTKLGLTSRVQLAQEYSRRAADAAP